ncbi:triose-phosphate isomerase [Cryptococcus neoformans]|uniref:Triosephosphate isomerase n=1 Tax=Cryptococcus neoformans (strain H99 / ATCC 208821 / CBS 10515 / FGSC 9487) TaxID=235443 RepID=J9VT31_CRYN9|nr:triose-phosphate isomerase [Cryptococcus neoformans var. grubii H99]AUB25629.1 triose-phosphate isomerase [Cryptococcus neoformans var. grubii]OWZ43293.1 triose-phosphate isomerase [Cryptococcus neoformans var. grubii C23]OWZ54136.1 triose-phosphate isomerase [Cryptococcus neoformans var. grubii 125.91]OXC84171.1 triose-phosphate isomerase [Cryptococcus neoformans var. grubii AD1-7a]OXG24381.1 triose-phosphate isomerase [Cryptococcus neoformans var. grubii Ze90-1]UOH82704.1 triose-phosphat|eukprot:XP_012049888.1 triose-phosphate isomerase [Cryptococcus neoformans var. grubii H99]
MPRQFFIGGNFKMNGSLESIEKIVRSINDAKLDGTNQVVIAPPALYLLKVQSELDAPTEVSAQNAFTESSGAFTGEIAPQQLKDANVHWVILGHSERRSLFGDTDKLVADKTKAALSAGLSVIACIGESLQERESDQTMTVVERQLEAIAGAIDGDAWKRIVIAYEPVWAIGTGKVATVSQAQEVHAAIRSWLARRASPEIAESTRIIYGGSVNGKNCGELSEAKDIDGFLVGGASLKPEFIDICKSGKKA